jgi:hypothetical protein
MNANFSGSSKPTAILLRTFEAARLHKPKIRESKENIMNWKKAAMVGAVGVALGVGTIASASADTVWQRHHPRREEVNNRLRNLNHRINVERREGEITATQARYLHSEDRAIRGQERFDAHFNNGHITRAEQRALNQDENGVSRQVGR